jgi:hypothetical protein
MLVGLVLLAIAVPVGKIEESHANRVQVARIEEVNAAIGGLDSPGLEAFRFDSGWTCLVYAEGTRRWAFERCYDRLGRLVETVDRRRAPPTFGSVAFRPELAPVRVPPAALLAVLRKYRVSEAKLRERGQ